MRSRNQIRGEEGAIAAVLLIVLILVLVVGAAFSFDYGNGLVVKENLQNATDAGSLAGVYELAVDPVTAQDQTDAENYARSICSSNKADSQAVIDGSNGCTVTLAMSPNTMPRTITLTATKITGNMFARMIGWNSMPVSSASTASASKGLKAVRSDQLMPIAVSLDHKPSKGPMQGKNLQGLAGDGAPFTLVLNPQGEKNASWLKNWNPQQHPLTTFGQDQLITNGVRANQVQALSPGDSMNIPIITGGPPFNKSRTVVGVAGFTVTSINFPHEISGTLKQPLILQGVPGTPIISGVDQQGQNFLDQNAPWQVSLTK